VDNLNVMPIVFGLLAVIFAAGVARSLVQIVRHPGPEGSPLLPARAAQPAPEQPRAQPLQALLGAALYALILLVLGGLLSRRPSRRG